MVLTSVFFFIIALDSLKQTSEYPTDLWISTRERGDGANSNGDGVIFNLYAESDV